MEDISLRNLSQRRNIRIGSPTSHSHVNLALSDNPTFHRPNRVFSNHHFPFYLPKRLFRWLYSISIVVISIFLIGFAAVMPIDAIAQTIQSSNLALKTLVIVIACVLFVVIGVIIYLTRIYQSKLLMDDIPKNYIPSESDLPKDIYNHIQSTFRYTEKVKVIAFPDCFINHPGLSPPENVQLNNEKFTNTGEAAFLDVLPSDLLYEDVIRSIGDKLKLDSTFLNTDMRMFKGMSFRECILSIPKQHALKRKALYNNYYPSDSVSSISSSVTSESLYIPGTMELLSIYEKLRFSGELITQVDFVEFMSLLNQYIRNFQYVIQTDFGNKDNENESISGMNSQADKFFEKSSGNGLKFWENQSISSGGGNNMAPRKDSRQSSTVIDRAVSYYPSNDKFRRNSEVVYNDRRPSVSYAKSSIVRPSSSYFDGRNDVRAANECYDNHLAKQPSGISHKSERLMSSIKRRLTIDHSSSGSSSHSEDEKEDEENDFYNFRSRTAKPDYDRARRKISPKDTSHNFRGKSRERSPHYIDNDTDSVKIYRDDLSSPTVELDTQNIPDYGNVKDIETKKTRTRSTSPIKRLRDQANRKSKTRSFTSSDSPTTPDNQELIDSSLNIDSQNELPVFSPIKKEYKKQHKHDSED